MFTILIFCAVLVGLLAITVLWNGFTRTRFYRLCVKIQGPTPIPVIGNVHHLWGNGKLFSRNFEDLCKKYPKLFRFFLGTSCFVVVQEPDDISTVLRSDKTLSKFLPYKGISWFLGDNLLTAARDEWKNQRRRMNSAFSINTVKNTLEVINRKSEIFIGVLKNKASGDSFDVFEITLMMTLDAILEAFLGFDCKVQENNRTDFIEAFETGKEFSQTLGESFFNFFVVLLKAAKKYKGIMQIRKFKAEVQTVASVKFKEYEANKCNQTGFKPSMSDKVLKYAQKNKEHIFDDFKKQCTVIAVTGSDTVAFTLSVCMMLLGLYRDVQDKVLEEIKLVFGDNMFRLVKNEDFQKLTYMEQVINETMRLFPVIFITGRKADEDIEVGGHLLPAGTNIIIPTYLLHRNPEYFPDPLKFDPERFSDENVRDRHPYCFIPFFAGPRNCIGLHYAMKVMKSVLCHVLRNFEILPCGTREDMEIVDMHTVLSLKRGYNLRIKPKF